MQAFDLSRYTALTPLGVSPLTQSFSAMCGGSKVLLKQLKPALAAQESTRRAWIERARLASQIRHPSLMEVLDYGEVDGAAYVAGAWIAGCSLRKALDLRPAEARKLEPGDVVSVARAVLTALDALASAPKLCSQAEAPASTFCSRAEPPASTFCSRAEPPASTPLLHLNITPNNLLLTPEGTVMLTEPGLWQAIPVQEAARLWFDSGKVGYQSPEQVEARGLLDARSDLFSLGSVLYELLTGVRPFTGKTQLMVAMAISRGERPPLAQARPGLPENLLAIVEALCAHAPDARFGSARAALRALETCEDLPCLLPELVSFARAAARQEPIAPKSSWQPGQPSDGNTAIMDAPKFGGGTVVREPRTEGPTSPFVWAHRPEGEPLTPSSPPSPPAFRSAPPSPAFASAHAHAETQGLAQAAPPPMVLPSGARAEPPALLGAAAAPFAPHHAPSVGLPSPVPPPMLPPLVGSQPEPAASAMGSRVEPPAPAFGSRAERAEALPSAPLNLPARPPVAPPPAFPAPAAPYVPPAYPAAAPPFASSAGPAPTPSCAEIPGAQSMLPAVAPLPTPLAAPSFAPVGPSSLAGEPPPANAARPIGPKRWQEPSKTLFEVKVRNLTDAPGPDRKRSPLALKLALVGMVAFGLVLAAALVIRALR